MLEIQPTINYYFLTLVLLMPILLIIMVVYIWKTYKVGRDSKNLISITTPLIYFSMGLLFPIIVHFITHLDGVFVVTIEVDVWYMLGYAVYSFGWVRGLNYYLKNTLRLTNRVKRRFNIFMNFILIIAILSFIASMFLFLLPELAAGVQRKVILISFATLGLSLSILFYRFIKAFRVERARNPSKITKARIDLMFKVLWIQIVLGISFFVLSTLVAMYPEHRSLLNLVIFSFTDILSTVAVIMLHWSIEIPDHIRLRYGISPARFSFIKHQ